MQFHNNIHKTRIIACGALSREILAIIKLNDLKQLDVKCLPAMWHNTPEKITPGVKVAIQEARQEGIENIFVAYADCGTSGDLDKLCRDEGVKRIAGPHCYSFFTGNQEFEKRWDDDMTSFFLTDFLTKQFRAFLIEPLKLEEHPELISAFFAHYTKLIYLAQTEDATLQKQAKEAADFLGLEYEYRFTGYGDLTLALRDAAIQIPGTET